MNIDNDAPVHDKTSPEVDQFMERVKGSSFENQFAVLKDSIDLVKDGRAHALLLFGDTGIGKTHFAESSLSNLEEGLDYCFLRGHTTPTALYQTLYEHNGEILIFDDYDSVFHNAISTGILKAALDNKYQRTVTYSTMRKNDALPQQFTFNGGIIFITNHSFRTDNSDINAIKDRCHTAEIDLSPKQRIEFIEHIIMPESYRDTTLEERTQILEFLRITAGATGAYFSFRTFFKLLDLYKGNPSNFKLHAATLLKHSPEDALCIKLYHAIKDKKERRLAFMKETGTSKRHYFDVRNRIIPFLPLLNSDVNNHK